MAVGDFITRAVAEANYKILGFNQEIMTNYASGKNVKMWLREYGGMQKTTLPKTDETSISPDRNLLNMRYQVSSYYNTSFVFSITNTKTFKLVLSDLLSDDFYKRAGCFIRVNHGKVIELSYNFKKTNTGGSYILYELDNLDATRIYTIEIYNAAFAATFNGYFAYDSIVLDKEGFCLPSFGMMLSAQYDDKFDMKSKYYYANNIDGYINSDGPGSTSCGAMILYKYDNKQLVGFSKFEFAGVKDTVNGGGRTGIVETMDLLNSNNGEYSFYVANTDKILISTMQYTTHSPVTDVKIDGVYYGNISHVASNSEHDLIKGCIVGEVKLPDRGIHKITITKKGTGYAYYDGVIADKAAMITPIGSPKSKFLIVKGTEVITKTKYDAIEYETDKSFNFTSAVKGLKINGKNRYKLKLDDGRYVVPKNSTVSVKTSNSYANVAAMPNFIDATVFNLSAAIGKGIISVLNGLKSTDPFNSVLNKENFVMVNRAPYRVDYGGGGIYASIMQFTSGVKYGSMDTAIFDCTGMYRNYVDAACMIYYAGNDASTQTHLIPSRIAFKTTSSFFSIWSSCINIGNRDYENDYLIYVNGVLRDVAKNTHPTDTAFISNRKAEIIRVEGLQPDDYVEIITTTKSYNGYYTAYGYAIDSASTITYLTDAVPAYEIVDENTFNALPNTLKTFKIDTDQLFSVLSNIITAETLVTSINVSSEDNMSGGLYEIESVSTDNLDLNTLYYGGYTAEEISNDYTLLNKINNEGYKLLTMNDSAYGLIESEYDLVEVKSVDLIKSIADKDIFIDKKPESATIAISANVTTSGDYGIREYSFPKNMNITKVVI